MGKDYYKYLGVNKEAIAGGGIGKRPAGAGAGAGGNGKGIGGIPLTGKDNHKSLGVKKAATAGGGNGKRPGGGAAEVPGGVGGQGWGVAPTFCPTDHSKTAVKAMNEKYHEEENRSSYEDKRLTFSSTHRTNIETSVKVTNEYFHGEEAFRVSEDGDKDEKEDIQDAAQLLADGGDGYGYGDYYKDAGVSDDDAGIGDVDDFLNGDNYYYDVAAAGFDDGYDDHWDGTDDWW